MKHIPLIALNPQTCLMFADYHKNAGHEEDHYSWLRLSLTLQTVMDYNEGQIEETMMRDQLDAAIHGRNERVVELTNDGIRPETIDDIVVPYVNPEITNLLDRDTEARR